MNQEIQEIFEKLDYKVDHRREPDEHRFKRFRKGWQDSISNKDKSYTANTLKMLTWQNLGYRFGKHLGTQTPDYIREVFDYLAFRYEEDAKSIVWNPVSGEDRLLQNYWKSVGGRIYVEVLIGGPGGPGKWPSISFSLMQNISRQYRTPRLKPMPSMLIHLRNFYVWILYRKLINSIQSSGP